MASANIKLDLSPQEYATLKDGLKLASEAGAMRANDSSARPSERSRYGALIHRLAKLQSAI